MTVIEVQEGSNAAKAGRVEVGDVLVGVSAVRFIGGAYLGKPRPERDIFPASAMDFDTVVDAISSNDPPEFTDRAESKPVGPGPATSSRRHHQHSNAATIIGDGRRLSEFALARRCQDVVLRLRRAA